MATPSIASLPDDVLVCILSGLTLQERHASAAPVCRRWRHLANSAPQLLRVVTADFGGGNERAAARLTSFCAWVLAHAAQHVQRLSLHVEPAPEDAPAGASERLSAALAGTLVGCGMAGGLTALWITASTEQSMVWMYGLRRLQRLVLIASEDQYPVFWDAPSSALPALEELALVGYSLTLPPHARLPPSLTKLHLEAIDTDSLPPQVSALTRLHTLSLRYAICTDYDGLACLPSLRRLELQGGICWPSCLSQLTGLEALALEDSGQDLEDEAAFEVIRQALPQLTRLTWLVLDAAPGMPAPPPELASLTRLQSFFWLGTEGGPLPTGPWLSSLQRLVSAGATIAASAAALATAPRLNFLVMLYVGQNLHLSLGLGAALRAPALQRLVCRASKEDLVCNLQALQRAQHQHPSVRLEAYDVEGTDLHKFRACCGYDPDAATSRDAFLAGDA